MKPLTRDILVTLSIKLILLVVLWAVCFRSGTPPYKNTRQWFFGSALFQHNDYHNNDTLSG